MDSNKNIYVKLELHNLGITKTIIRPSYYSWKNSGGLCGYFNNFQGDDAYTWVVNGQGKKREIGAEFQMADATIDEVEKFWK